MHIPRCQMYCGSFYYILHYCGWFTEKKLIEIYYSTNFVPFAERIGQKFKFFIRQSGFSRIQQNVEVRLLVAKIALIVILNEV